MTLKDKKLESNEVHNPIVVVRKLISGVCLMIVKYQPISLLP